MNQQAIDWLLTQEPDTPTIASEKVTAAHSGDLFSDIPTIQEPKQAMASTPVKDDLFADIPVTPQAIEQEPSLWGQFKAGIADVASGYYSNKALQQAEEYQAIKDNKTGLLGLSKLGIYDVNTGVISPNKEQELKEREEEIAAALKKSQEYQTYSENMPMPESVRNFLDPTRESHSSWWEDLKVAPVEIAFNVTAKSGPASLLSLGGAMVGGVTAGLPGAMAGSGAVSGRIEYINSIKQGLQEAGIDWTDPQAFISAINNDELMDPIREKGLKRGIAIGTLDAAAALVGGKVLAPKSLFAKSAAKAQGINLPAQVVAQAGLGAGGEAAGQYWSEGEITDVRAIAAEAVGEMTFAPVEAAATLYSVSRGSKGIARDRLKATNELLDILNRKRQKAYNSRDPQAIAKANTEFNEYLNIRQELEQQLKNTDAESLLKAEKTLSTVINAKQRQYNQANAEQRPALERELKELNKRRDVVFDAIHSQGRTIQSPELMEQKEALDLVKADREFRQEQRRAEEEELYHKRTNPLAAADEEARRIAAEGGDALDQQLGASNAYSTARSTDEMADDIASMEGARQATEREQDLIEEIRRTEQQYADSQGLKKIVAQKKLKNLQQQLQTLRSQPVEEAPTDVSDTNVVDIATPTTPTEEPYQPKSLYQIVREGKERRAREGDWEAAEAQAQAQEAEQTQQEIAAWEASQGITEQEAIQQRRQENLHNELRKAWQQVHQQSVNEAHGIIDEAMELGLIDDEASARQLADNGEIPPDLTQRIANEKRLLAREKAETDREAFVEKQQHRQKVARLEQHIADQQKARDYELALQQRDENLADITEGEINDWEDLLGITQETAIDEAAQARQARQPTPEPSAEALLAERVRYAHQVVDAAITNGSIGLLGEPIARQYADRGEIPPSLMSEADQLADQISRLEQHIQSGQMADQARTGWTAEQPAHGAMQDQGATEYTPVERKPPEQETEESQTTDHNAEQHQVSSSIAGAIQSAVANNDTYGMLDHEGKVIEEAIGDMDDAVFLLETLIERAKRKGKLSSNEINSNLIFKTTDTVLFGQIKDFNESGNIVPLLEQALEKLNNRIKKTEEDARTDKNDIDNSNKLHEVRQNILQNKLNDLLKNHPNLNKEFIRAIVLKNFDDAVGMVNNGDITENEALDAIRQIEDKSGFYNFVELLDNQKNTEPNNNSKEPTQDEQPKQTEQTPEKRRLITNQEREAQEEARFEQQLQQIGKEWIKDQQHRFYFSDIIQQLSGTDQPIPANAKLWYDKRTGFYGSENLSDEVYDAAVERLELLRQSIIDEHGEQALEPVTPESDSSSNNEITKSLNNDQEESTQSLEDLKALHQDLIKQRNEAEYQDIQAGRTPTSNARLDDRIRQTEDAIKQMEQEQPDKIEGAGIRGFTNESGSHTFNKVDDSTETFEYNRIADLSKVSGSPNTVAPFFVELKEGDLLIDRWKQIIGVVSHTKGGKIHFKGEREPQPINVEVHKDDRRKLGDEIRRLKAEQKGKPAPKEPTVTTEETASENQWVRITHDDIDQLPIGSTIRISTGTPKPTAKQAKKLKEWEKFNVTGTLKEKGNYGGTPHLTLFKGMNGFMPNQSMYPMHPDLIFEVEQQPGTVSDNETIKSLNNDQEQGATTAPQGNRRKPIESARFNTPLEFGKHKGKTINEIGAEDRGYLRKIADSPFKNNEALAKAANEWLDNNGTWSDDELNGFASLLRHSALNEERPLLSRVDTTIFNGGLVDIEPKANHVNITQDGKGKKQPVTYRITYKALADVLTDQEVSQLKKLADSDTVESPPSIETTSETTPDENTGRTGQGTLEGVSTGTIQGATGSGDTGPRSTDRTGESGGIHSAPDGHNELRGSEADSLLGTDLHPPGGISNTSDDGDRRGGINSPSADFVITETQDYDREKFSVAERFQGNIDAIKLLKSLGTRPATPEQKKILAGYVGWGGMKNVFDADGQVAKGWEKRHAELKALLTEEEYNAAMQSTQNAHYTSWPVINAIYTGLEKIGFTGGRLLETSVGVGNFFGMMPPAMRQRSRLIGVELDHITGGIADKLYGNSARIHQPRDFAEFDFAEATYDVVTGNPPFGAETITDLKHKDISGMRIHNYFLLKSMKALRPGGVLAVVVSKGFMDSSANQKGREMMFREARLLGAWRLPNEAFGGQANTDVTTDVIFLQKRENPLIESEAREVDNNPFTNTSDFVGSDGNTMKINEYFVANPKHLLGDMVLIKGRYSEELEPTLNARKGLNWKKALLKGTKKLEGNYQPEENIELSSVIGNPEASTDIEKAEVNGLYITDTGELYRRFADREGETQGAPVTTYVNGQGTEITLRPNQINILKQAVTLARTARELINLQITDITDPELEPLRQRLNREYDRFIKKNKMINRPYNKSLLINADLTIAPLLMALENNYRKEVKDDKKKLVQTEQSTKADIFTKRTQEPYKPISKVETSEQALLVTLGQLGKVDLDRMSELSGIGQDKLIEQLQGQIFDDPVEGWVTRDEYLSGNVKLKLRQAEEAGLTDYARVLKKALPEDVPATDIVTVFGAHWQTPEVINAFWEHLGGTQAKTTYVPERSDWIFTGTPSDKKRWRTDEFTMLDMFERTLNNRTLAVTYKDKVTGKTKLDVRATDAALAKADEIRNEFVGWLWRDEQRREGMVRRYNDLVNTHKNRQYDGSFLSLPGMNKNIQLYDTQKNAVWRTLQSKTTLLDHIVGAGKTFTMIASAMEMKRTGMAKKPMFVVPNHLIGQWAEDFARLYPNAKVLAATSKDLGTHKRREFLARIATGNWDAVIVAHSSFGKIPTDPATERWFLEQQIKDADKAIRAMKAAEGNDKRTVAQAAKARDRLKNKLKESMANTDKDQGLTWNEMGIDALFVDEAHEFKNLSFMTSMNRVKNVNPEGSDMAMDLFIKTQALLRNTGGRNLVFATGTPVSNSMAELFTMQRYLDYDGLTQSKTNYFDAWAKTFGRTVSKMERKSSGKYDRESRFAEFINLPELIAKYRTFADTINQEDIDAARAKNGEGKIVPKVKGGKPQVKIAPRSMFQEAYMGEIENRFANMPTDPREDNPLWATNDARKAALDMRLVYEDLPDDPNSKINLAVDEMIRVYHQWQDDKGTQLVFCDLSTPKKSQAEEIKNFKTRVKELAKKDKEQSPDIDKLSVMEAYEYLQSMADREVGNAVDMLDKISLDEVSSWTSNFDVYNDVKQKLIDQGVPANEIAYIHDAKTQPQKDELFDKVKRGDIRFLLGSTAKMGAGTNVQNRLVALHHLDAPWRPSDLEQREGRIIRQGNEFFKRDPEGFEVEILRYATEQTYDTNMWQTLEVKALFIQQLRKGNLTDRSASDIAGEAATAAEMKAASSGDPRIIEMVDLTAELRRLDNLRTTHQSNRTQASIDAGRLTKEQQYLPKLISRLKEDLNNTLPIPVKGPALKTPEGDGFTKAKEANEWFKKQVLKGFKNPNSPLWDGAVIASYRGFDVYVEISTQGKGKDSKQYVEIELVGEQNHRGLSYHRIDDVAWDGLTARFNNSIGDIPGNIKNAEQRLVSLPPLIEENETLARTPWPHEEDYQDKQERNRELMEELSTEEVENPAAKWQPEYELFRQMAVDFEAQKKQAQGSAKKLEFSAKQNRANRLMEMILYSKPSQEKAQAKKAMALAKEQQFKITDQAMKEARQRADEALAQHKLAEEQKKQQAEAKAGTGTTEQATTTENTTAEITFTSQEEAVTHALDNKQAITADNGKIRLERKSIGYWQLSVDFPPNQAGFDDDSIVMDNGLMAKAGTNFKAVGDKMVMTFPESRLKFVVWSLFSKMPLQGMQARKAEKAPNVRFRRGDNSDIVYFSDSDVSALL